MTRIYVDHISPRIEYTFEFIFGSRGLTYHLTDDIRAKVDLSYSQNSGDANSFIEMADFMLSDKIENLEIGHVNLTDDLACFSFNSISDPIASIFYSLSRYEEYVCTKTDEYGRFPLAESKIAPNWLMKAMCDRWAEYILIQAGINDFQREFNVKLIPTFDIDNTYAYKLKSGKRKWMSIFKDLVQFNFERIKERSAVLRGKTQDPYNTFSKIKSVHSDFPDTKVFWLIGKWGKKDRNISIHNEQHRKLIKSLVNEGLEIGLHPSFASFGRREVINQEKSA